MISTPSRLIHSSTILAPGSFTWSSITFGGPDMAPKPPTLVAPRRGRGAPRPNPQRSGRPSGAVAPLDDSRYAFGAPSADASRARRRACAALSRAIGIMNGEQDTYVIPTL